MRSEDFIRFGASKKMYKILYGIEMTLYSISIPTMFALFISVFLETPILFEVSGTLLLCLLFSAIVAGKKAKNLKWELLSLRDSLRLDDEI